VIPSLPHRNKGIFFGRVREFAPFAQLFKPFADQATDGVLRGDRGSCVAGEFPPDFAQFDGEFVGWFGQSGDKRMNELLELAPEARAEALYGTPAGD